MPMDAQMLASLAAAFLEAPLTPDGWERALKMLGSVSGSARGQIIGIGGPHLVPFNKISDTAQAEIDRSAALGVYTPEVNWRIAATGRPLEVISEPDYRAVAQTMRSDVYDDFTEWFGCQFGCQTTLRRDASGLIGLAVLRTRADGETSAEDRAAFAQAAPYVLNAVHVQEALQHQGAQMIAGALEAMHAAAFICDPFGRVMALTGAAERSLRDRPVLTLTGRILSAVRPEDDGPFQAALKRVLTSEPPGEPAAPLWLSAETGRNGGRICEVFALPRKEWDFGFEPKAMVTLRTPSDPDAAQRNVLRQAFHLTAAESEIALLAAGGMSREEIASARGAAYSTIASQFKSIFAKTGVKREAELVALINRLLR